MGDVLGPALIDELEGIARDLATPDAYVVKRRSSTNTSSGTTGSESTVETGTCLVTAQLSADGRIAAEQLGLTRPIQVRNLPRSTVVTEKDTILIGSRRLDVKLVQRGGAWQPVVNCLCEERT